MKADDPKAANSTQSARKRRAESPVLHSSPSGNEPAAKRVKKSADTAEATPDEWNQLEQKLKDVFSGRADGNLTGWGDDWNELCDSLCENKKAKKEDIQLMKEVGAIVKHCADLERRIGIR